MKVTQSIPTVLAALCTLLTAQSAVAAPQTKPTFQTSFSQIKQIDAGVLNIGYAEAGPANGQAVLLLHGWPYDIYSYVDVVPLLATAGYHVIVPYLRGFGSTRFLSTETLRNGQPSAFASDMIALMDALKIKKAIVGGFDWGTRTADDMAVLWPDRVKGLVSVSGFGLGTPSQALLPPSGELAFWYQDYFASDRGRDGYAKFTHDFDKLIWRTASPKWDFDDATFDRSASAFDNPDHVAITIFNYRYKLGLLAGESKYDELEKRLAKATGTNIPTITMEGDANGAPHAPATAYAPKFTGKYEYRLITGGIGHNLPQEAPRAFAQAIIDVDHF